MRLQPDGSIGPGLARSFSQSADGRSFTFELRPDVEFHDGSLLNAEAATLSLQRVLNPQLRVPLRAPFDANLVESVVPLGPLTLRITLKDLGDDSARYLALRPGTRAFAEGPYGAVTGARRRLGRVLLIAGGIGITPLRALLEEMPDGQGITLLYRASDWSDVVFREELAVLARNRAVELHYLVGERGSQLHPEDPLGPVPLSRLVPDARQRDIFVCGPTAMMDAVHRALRALRVPSRQIHMERFSY